VGNFETAATSEIGTPRGPARVKIVEPVGEALSLLVLGHGAGGDVDAPDLTAVAGVAAAAGIRVALITQPYRVAGRKAPAPAGQLDEAWTAVVTELVTRADVGRAAGVRSGEGARLPLIVGGRSSGARVACRTAGVLGAAGVLALAFPLHPPGKPEKSRAGELPIGPPTLVVNGDRDPFGVPEEGEGREIVVRPGAVHDLRKDLAGTAAAVLEWLTRHGWSRRP
jgi:uncharacterized protein